MSKKNSLINSISIAVIPFLLIISIGLFKAEWTYHMKVFKTLMIFIFDILLTVVFFIFIVGEKDINKTLYKQRKYLLYFLLYFLFIFIQYIVSFLSKEYIYDRNYYLGNYIFLIVLALYFFLFLKNIEEIEIGLLVINFYFLIVIIWGFADFVNNGWSFNGMRPKLSFGNTNYFAAYHISLIPLGIVTPILWLINIKKQFYKIPVAIVTAIITALSIFPLFLTKTRAAYLGVYVGVGLIFIPSLVLVIKKIPRIPRILITCLLYIIVITTPVIIVKSQPAFLKPVLGRVYETINDPEFYINDRLNGWAGGLGLFKDHPVMGAGLGSVYPASFKYIGKYFALYSDSNSFKHSHNEYVEVLGEGGGFGLLFFIALFGFVIVLLLRNVVSDNYKTKYRLISLAVASGIISVLTQQIFSLTLRMSVTMTAYFALLGIGIFLISISKKMKLEQKEEKESKNRIMAFLNKGIELKERYIITGVVFLFIIFGAIMFFPLFWSENNLINAMKTREGYQKTMTYFNKALIKKPDNVYVLTQKYSFLMQVLSMTKQVTEQELRMVDEVEDILDRLNALIPGYQDIWSKYGELYSLKSQFYQFRFKYTRNFQDYKIAQEAMLKSYENINTSLNHHFLNQRNHMLKLYYLYENKNKPQYIDAVRDYLKARIFLDIAKKKKIVKENIYVDFTNNVSESNVEKNDEKYTFHISEKDVTNIVNLTFGNNIDMNRFDEYINDLISQEIVTLRAMVK